MVLGDEQLFVHLVFMEYINLKEYSEHQFHTKNLVHFQKWF